MKNPLKNHMQNKIDKIAVVGMAGVFPKALNTNKFLDNIINKRNCVIKVPAHRWPGPVNNFVSQQNINDKAATSMAGIIENFNFDPDNFLVDKDLLSELDPLHQLVLHAGRDAFLQCSHTEEEKKRTGVILAAIALPTDASSEISHQIICNKNYNGPVPKDFSRAGVVSLPAAILARAMGFYGGSFTLDAACASSLYSIKLACEHLHLKKADIMVAGGVSRPDSLYTQIGFTQLKALSPSGICAPFDKTADGLVVGEGCGIVVLKRLEDAINSGDKIHAVITGAGASNDIEGNLVGPAKEGQVRAMLKAYEQASWSPADIQYMECHGSGTPVGDKIELSSIKALLDTFNCPETPLSIGSVKSMTGHLLTAAGATGFIKTILSMNEGILPPSLNYTEPPGKSILNDHKIKVQTKVENWDPETGETTRKAGISAFGFGGINAHLLVEEFKKSSGQHFIKNIDKDKILKKVDCAIIGMETITKECNTLADFSDLISGKTRLNPALPKSRWKTTGFRSIQEKPGFYMDRITPKIGEFHIPPNQMEDILPQQIALLTAAKGALKDANISHRPLEKDAPRNHIGCAIGIEFDYGATDFHLRWKNHNLDEKQKDALSPPLTFNRTLGALGGIVASRVAREFKLGGPCFTLSAGSASGIKAIETGVHSLSSGETDIFICGSVDLAGDIRQFALNDAAGKDNKAILPSEGAAAIVLKRLDQALKDGDRIYGVITGTAGAGGGSIPGEIKQDSNLLETVYTRSLENALKDSKTSLKEISFYEAGISGIKESDTAEVSALNSIYSKSTDTLCHVTSVSSIIGNTRGASSLFSVIKTALCLYHRLLPGNKKIEAYFKNTNKDQFTFADMPARWNRGSKTKRKACAASITMDGACSHVIMEEMRLADEKNQEPQDNIQPDHLPQDNIQPENMQPDNIQPENIQHDAPVLDPGLITRGSVATSNAHEKFLEFSKNNMLVLEQQFETLTKLAGHVLQDPGGQQLSAPEPEATPPFLTREQCLEFAVGKAGNVLGKEFEIIDTYPVRVRLPAEPLMLVDRIMHIEGEMLSLTPGKIITQHDVKENAWYLDGGKAPVSISIEAGQADLFLCTWLGIDHAIKGKRKYRLLDASVTFHRTLPEPGETIEYHIEIDRFLKQGDVYLFFFHYKGYINGQLLISMRDGCAGFFTEEEVENSGGIILKTEELEQIPPKKNFSALVPVKKLSFSDEKVEALRNGDLEKAFGQSFKNKKLGQNLILPGLRMHLLDRVLEFNPKGGRFGLGSIIAESDIHPDDWFLICHFIDDRVMPGTLMYECCAHALRIFTQRMGWISDRNDVHYDVIPDNESDLKCRGPVTPDTKKARYEIEIKEMGYGPEPYVIADAHMFSDDLRIVLYKNMGMKLVGLTQSEIESFWRNK